MKKFDLNETVSWTIPQLLTDEGFRDRFIFLYNFCHPKGRLSGDAFLTKEIEHFRKMYLESDSIKSATATSVAVSFLNMAYYGLSVEPQPKAVAYIVPESKNIGTKDNAKWEKRVAYKLSPYGEISIRIDTGVIRGITGPILVHEGDPCEIVNGEVMHISKNLSTKIIGGWMRIHKNSGLNEDKYFSIEQINSYRKMSKDQNSTAWTGGVGGQPTRGMIEAKIIRHSLDTIQRANLRSTADLLDDEDFAASKEAAYASVMAEITGGSESQNGGDNNRSWSEPVEEPGQNEPDPPVLDEWNLPKETPTAAAAKPEIVKKTSTPTFFD